MLAALALILEVCSLRSRVAIYVCIHTRMYAATTSTRRGSTAVLWMFILQIYAYTVCHHFYIVTVFLINLNTFFDSNMKMRHPLKLLQIHQGGKTHLLFIVIYFISP